MSPLFTASPTITLERKPSGGYTLITHPHTLHGFRVDLTEEQYKELKKQMVLLDGLDMSKLIMSKEELKRCGGIFEFEPPQPTGNGRIDDAVNHPKHYNNIPGIECIEVVRHMNFNRGNAVKYIWRADDKGDPIENLSKAIWYLQDEIDRLKRQHKPLTQTFNELRAEYGQGWQDDNAD